MVAFTMMALGLNIVVGYAGLLDLGYVAFYAVGAYTAGWFASQQFDQITFHFLSSVPNTQPGIHVTMWLVLIAAGLLTMLAGIIIGLPTLRLRGDYLAIVTLGFGEIVPQVVNNGDSIGGFDLTHGTFGIAPIDSVGFPILNFDRASQELPDLLGPGARGSTSSPSRSLLITVFCTVRLRDSRLGRAWIAIREDETAAAAMGVPLMRTKTWSYAIGAFFGGVAGAYYASFRGGAFPADFYFNISVFILCMVILGGMGSVWGVIAGGMILSYLNIEGLSTIGSKIQDAGLNFDPTKYQFGIYGTIIVAMMLLRPAGLIPERRHRIELEEGVHDTPFYDVEHEGTLDRPRPERRLMAEPDDLVVATKVRKEFGGLIAIGQRRLHDPARRHRLASSARTGPARRRSSTSSTGVYKPTSGSIVFDGTEVSYLPPHAITKLGIGRTFQNIRLFSQMNAIENVLVGMHCRMHAGILGAIVRTPKVKREEAASRDKARELLTYCGLAAPARGALRLAPVRRPAAARGRTRARHGSQAPPPRRANRGHEPAGDSRVHVVRPEGARREGRDRAPHRARHEGDHGRLGADHGARIRREDRGGHAGRDQVGPTCHRGVPRQGSDRVSEQAPPGDVLQLDEVHVYYGAIHALKGVSLRVKAGEIVTLIGANGAGKSTTLRAINGLNRPRQGTIRFQGETSRSRCLTRS